MAYPGFVLEATLKQNVADVLKRSTTASLKPYIDRIVALANNDAYYEILGALGARGFTLAQIEQWDRGVTFQTSLGLFWCGIHGAAHFKETEGELFAEFDRREELKTVDFTIDGEIVTPDETDADVGPVGFGTMEKNSGLTETQRRAASDVHQRFRRFDNTARRIR